MSQQSSQKQAVKQVSLAGLKQNFRGTIIERTDGEYDTARRLYNAMIDKRPQVIVRPRSTDDIVSSINYARGNNLQIAIRGGGHNGAGFGCVDDGVVVDMQNFKEIVVDPARRTVFAGAGCTQGEVDAAAHVHGLAVPAGIISTTGIAGLTLGGGHGYLTRKYGLTIDNLLEVEIVLADGRVVKANANQHPDLFWAVRGGGGNFGVVTSFTYRAHPVKDIYGGPMFFPADRITETLKWYRDFMPNAHEDLYGFYATLRMPPLPGVPENLVDQVVCAILWCYLGAPEDAAGVFAPIRNELQPMIDGVTTMPFPSLQTMHDVLLPTGMQWYWRGDIVSKVSDEAVALHEQFAHKIPPGGPSTMHLYPIDGAVHRVGKHDTAFSYRDANWSMVIAGIHQDPARAEAITTWTKTYWEAVHPFTEGGAYVNFMMDEGRTRVMNTYRDNYPRLVQVKRSYDPHNVFCVNQNIVPGETS